MGVHKQSVSFTDAAYAYARELVERGDYPNVSAAVSSELARARAARETGAGAPGGGGRRRIALPLDRCHLLREGVIWPQHLKEGGRGQAADRILLRAVQELAPIDAAVLIAVEEIQ